MHYTRSAHRKLKWILDSAHSPERLARLRLRLDEYGCNVEYQPWITHNVADGATRLWKREEQQDEADDKTARFVTTGSPDGDARQRDNREAVVAI